MRLWSTKYTLPVIADTQRMIASSLPPFQGMRGQEWIIEKARFYIQEFSALCIFTLDTGHHSCGWWKNPDYETCWHLSISFKDPESGSSIPFKPKIAQEIVQAFFEGYTSLIWCEPPYSEEGKQADSWHYRLFIDTQSKVPILPRGEVYSKQFTERGWKSFSELKGDTES